MVLRMLHDRFFSINAQSILRYAMVGVITVGLLSACSGRIATRGNTPDPERLIEIQPKEISKDGVQELLGSPSTVGSYEKQDTWVYFSEKTETFAFFEPEVIERKIIVIQFDDKGVVSKVRTLGINDSNSIDPIARKTPSAGEELTVFDQIKANIEKFLPSE
jgi:outer membrane protein assembly factor BamE (lipoprotein component of BamABCDE complex)